MTNPDAQGMLELADEAIRRLRSAVNNNDLNCNFDDSDPTSDIRILLTEYDRIRAASAPVQGALDSDGAKQAAEAIFDYTENNLSMFEACIEEEPVKAKQLYETAKTLKAMFNDEFPSPAAPVQGAGEPVMTEAQIEQLTNGIGCLLSPLEAYKLGWRCAMRAHPSPDRPEATET